ncbi:Ldh family oxidoreductase [Silicimonas sp. MF1-12-2]|uniref:Ldh family oxidoreductase n=1 Tax=Silicimonas sp. MF1-12-2 TaxID=3384793 RepID=UPI0039B5E3B4
MTIPAETLRDFARRCYAALGLPDTDAALVADSLVQSDLWGHPSHGIMRLFWYAVRLESGAMSPVTRPELSGKGALLTMNGNDGVGQVVARAAMDAAITASKTHGIGAVAVRNSGHFGTAMYFTRMAAREGCIGYLATNASPAMAPWGGLDKRLGTNPWSWAAPAGRYAPVMLDIANTAVARGKLYAAKAKGDPIPEGWAMDADGNMTTDAALGIAGTILPMAGHKGYAVSFITDMLAGVLSGSAFGTDVTGPYVPEGRSGAGHFVIAIDIAASRPLAEFEADMERLIDEIKSARPAPGSAGISYPGEIEALNETRNLAEGIDLPEAVIGDLIDGADRIGVPHPF